MSDELIENKPIPYICTVEEMTEQLVEMIKFPDMAITPPDSPILWSFLTDFEETEELEEYKHHNKKNTRRVTFNLEKNELIYYSAISYTSSEASDEDNTVNNTLLVEHPMDSLLNNQPMSRKDIMNMLEKRRENKRYKSPVIQPTHWLPSSASSTLTRVNRVHIPEIRSLELTEKLIEEIIQREIAIYPHLSSNIPHKEDNALINAPRSSYSSEESDTISAGSSDNVPSIQEYPLPTDTNIDYHADTNIDYRTDTNIDYHPIKKSESNFITSYHKMEKIHGKEVIPHNTIQHKDIDIHPNTASVQPVDDISSICMEVTSKPIKDTVPEIKQPLSGSLFMRIVKTESVDLPLSDNSSVEIDCGIYYDSHEVSSVRQPLGRIMNIDHEITM
ncbi:hypothetical protein BDB01DRAFT_573507 [Pilobolus umbonatus]|nr:hypothetical protein BDB01DRAFT_573507 [Pilobolus umbonatus]